ncbi:hypothetical protein HGRIS_013395 [Hohenbuehelia grisea]|uniref:Uncharacterized protein n=1 Tax=Hohenbuehelia grisea TaxID=104357 RepID=A0ABR3IVG1_9AGAR
MDQVTSDLSQVSLNNPSDSDDVLQKVKQWLSENQGDAAMLTTARNNYEPSHPKLFSNSRPPRDSFPDNLRMFVSRDKPKQYTQEKINALKQLDLAEFMLEVFAPDLIDPTIHAPLNYPPGWQAEVLHTAFNQLPRGNIPQELLKTLSELEKEYDPSVFYGKIIAALQSSAIGKTYTMYQLRKIILSVTVCLRSIGTNIALGAEPGDDGWPPQDQPACAFFRENNDQEWNGEELAGAFLGALFRVMDEKLKGSGSLEAFNDEWTIQDPRELFESLRHETFGLVRTTAQALLVQNQQALMSARGIIPHDKQIGHTASEWHMKIHEILIQDAMSSLLATHQDMNLGKFIVIAFDECTELNTFLHNPRDPYPQRRMTLIALQRMMKTCEERAIWFFLLDTNSSVTELHPPKTDKAPSARLRQEHSPLPPWPYFGFDLMVDPAELKKPKPARIGLSLEHWKIYGRPYWFGLPQELLLDSAGEKLFAARHMRTNEDAHVLAAFSHRVLIDLANTEVASSLAATAVRKHMRILLGVVDRSIVQSAAPSEPMLSVAAAVALLKSPETYRAAIATFVTKIILQKDVINLGTLGELLARTILTMARDGALWGSPFVTGMMVNPVSVSQFLKMLVKYDMPKKLTDLANRYVINFSHFYQLSKDTAMLKPDFLRKCWYRGVALQGSHNQPVWDILIPAYKADQLDAPFDVKNLLLLVIQVKCRSAASSVEYLTAPFIDPGDSKDLPSKPPHIAILMDLAATSTFFETRTHIHIDSCVAIPPRSGAPPKEDPSPKTSSSRPATSKPLSNYAIKRTFFSDTSPETKRWFIRLRGHEGDVYPVISQLGPTLLQTQLWGQSQELLSDAAQKFMRALDPLSHVADSYS